jgi:hypothetical protein
MVPSDVLKPLRSFRAAQPPTPVVRRTQWRVGTRSITDPSGRVIPLIRHGIDRYTSLRLVDNAVVLNGNFPSVTDVTTELRTVQQLIEQVSTSGNLLTVYASLYRDRSRTILLLDYLH